MIINVDKLIDGETLNVSFSENISIPEDYSVNGDVPVKVIGELSNNSGKFRFRGNVSAKISLNCDLCLCPFDMDIDFEIDEIFVKSPDDNSKDDDFWYFSDNVINLKTAILSNILLNIPMRAVCSDECKGLCSICGHNLNEGDCGCEKTYINPKFEKLLALFEENEEEV